MHRKLVKKWLGFEAEGIGIGIGTGLNLICVNRPFNGGVEWIKRTTTRHVERGGGWWPAPSAWEEEAHNGRRPLINWACSIQV